MSNLYFLININVVHFLYWIDTYQENTFRFVFLAGLGIQFQISRKKEKIYFKIKMPILKSGLAFCFN